MKKLISLCAVLVAGLADGTANAQYVGDVFAKTPSVAALPGSVVTIEADLFSGANVFGASSVDLTYTDAQLSFVGVAPSSGIGQPKFIATTRASGRISFASFNKNREAMPIGTIALGLIKVKVNGSPGQIIRYQLTPTSLLMQNAVAYSASSGFTGEIVLVSTLSSTAVPSTKAALASVRGDEFAVSRALQMRRSGSKVLIVDPIQQNGEVVPRQSVVETGTRDVE